MIQKLTTKQVRELKGTSDQPYIAYCENKKSSHLLIYFGSYGGEFAGMTNVESIGCNAIFVRSDKATWYVQNYKDIANGPIEFAEYIDNFVKTLKHIKTICIAGFSMGGYGALLFASKINANRVVATAPQTTFPDFPVEKVIPTYPEDFPDHFKSIEQSWGVRGIPNAEIILQSCDMLDEKEHFRDILDVTSLLNAYPNNIKLIKYKCAGHKGITNALLSNKIEYEKLFVC